MTCKPIWTFKHMFIFISTQIFYFKWRVRGKVFSSKEAPFWSNPKIFQIFSPPKIGGVNMLEARALFLKIFHAKQQKEICIQKLDERKTNALMIPRVCQREKWWGPNPLRSAFVSLYPIDHCLFASFSELTFCFDECIGILAHVRRTKGLRSKVCFNLLGLLLLLCLFYSGTSHLYHSF